MLSVKGAVKVQLSGEPELSLEYSGSRRDTPLFSWTSFTLHCKRPMSTYYSAPVARGLGTA